MFAAHRAALQLAKAPRLCHLPLGFCGDKDSPTTTVPAGTRRSDQVKLRLTLPAEKPQINREATTISLEEGPVKPYWVFFPKNFRDFAQLV
jgi:hypothetical protein